jgi:general secretion pathway protein M
VTALSFANLSPLSRRLLAIAILFGVIYAVVFGFALPAWQAYDEARSTGAELEIGLKRMAAIAGDQATLDIQLAQMRSRRAASPGFLTGATDTLAAVELQTHLKSATESAHGEFRSAQILPARDEGSFRRISVRTQMKVRFEELIHILYQLESETPFLFVENLQISAEPRARQRGETGLLDDNPVLGVAFDLSGYLRKPAGGGA